MKTVETDVFIHHVEFDSQSHTAGVHGASVVIGNKYTDTELLRIDLDNQVLGLHAVNGLLCIGKAVYRNTPELLTLQRPESISEMLTFIPTDEGWTLRVRGVDENDNSLNSILTLTDHIIEIEVEPAKVHIRSISLNK